VEVGRLVERGEQTWHLPAEAGEHLADDPALLVQVVPVVVDARRGEGDKGARLGRVAVVAADAGQLARHVVQQRAAAQAEVVGQVPGGHVVAEVADEPSLRSEGEPAHVGVHPVGADHQVEGAARAAGEGDLDAPRLLGQATWSGVRMTAEFLWRRRTRPAGPSRR
jgi:hypothetical protein